ncbi:MAG: carboxypeptidase regulatory-like domain-containing protein, partial [Muribaculaceae bacterium]|nr:carboxypeptidase regulatory-like domain-containing protein [Muribaculaceae bacterium]
VFEVTPAQGYQLTGVTITAGNEAIVPEVAENTYSFTMPESDVNINVATELIPAKTYPINVQAMENGSVVADPIAAAIGETVTLTVAPADGYELETISVTAGREIQGGSGGARAPHVKMWQSQGNIELTKVDDTHYTFVLPEELPNVLTPNYTDNTEFKVSATFKLAPVPTRVITGKVVDKKGNALEGVSVVALVKNVEPAGISRLKAEGDLSTTTDENGEFSLEVPADQQYDLTFSKAGYKSQTVGEDEVPGTGLVMAKDYPTAIDAIVADENVAGVKYVSVNGQVSDQPFDGVNIVVIEKVDGTKTVTKIRK